MNNMYLTFCLAKKKAPLCWDLQTSNWCFNVKENILQIIIIVQLDLLFILKKSASQNGDTTLPCWLLELHFRVVQKLLQRKTYLDHFQVQDWTCALSAVIPVPRLFVVYLYSRPRIKFTHQ